MKSQTIITTLAVLLAVCLTAIGAMVLTSDLIGGTSTVADDTPVSVFVADAAGADTAGTDAAARADAAVVNTQPTEPSPSNVTPVDPDPVDPADEPAAPEADADPPANAVDEEEDPLPVVPPADAPPAPEAVEPPADVIDDAPEGDAPEAPEVPEAPVDDAEPPADAIDEDDPAPADPEDGDTPIACNLGYVWDGTECVFVGCPTGFHLVGQFCLDLPLAQPCADGFFLSSQGCVPVLVFDPPVVVVPEFELCLANQVWIDGECTYVFDRPDLDLELDLDLSGLGI